MHKVRKKKKGRSMKERTEEKVRMKERKSKKKVISV